MRLWFFSCQCKKLKYQKSNNILSFLSVTFLISKNQKTFVKFIATSSEKYIQAVTVLINSAYSSLEDTHLLVLLNYAEEDLYSAERQSYAFPLLHALLKRRLRSEEMESIGDKVLKLAITGETDAARNGARTFLCTYLMEVCFNFLEKKLKINFSIHLEKRKSKSM